VTLTKNTRVYVAGHRGLVGSALVRSLQRQGFDNLIVRSHQDLDLTEQAAVREFFEVNRPQAVIMAAARVGGIHANNSHPAGFLRDNLLIQDNVIDAAYRYGVEKFVFLGSSCIYPKMAPQPIKEDYLLTGPLEPTNEWYAIAKIAGIKLCQAFRRQYGFSAISLMPTNLYGPGDNYHPENSHVLPALLQRFHLARLGDEPEVVVWGSGTPRREFLYIDDLADAAVFAMRHYDSGEILNVGTGTDITIADLARLIARVTGYRGRIAFDASKPDGMPRKLLDVSRFSALGWKAKTSLEEGIQLTYEWFQSRAVVA
jgi:GDP-L-fucose synthase